MCILICALVSYVHKLTCMIMYDNVYTLFFCKITDTVIRFFFVVKIFSYRENVQNFFTRILFYNETFSDEYLGQVRNDAVLDR